MKFLLSLLICFFFISLTPSMAYNGGYSPGYEPYTKNDGVKPWKLIPFKVQFDGKECDILKNDDFEIKVDRTTKIPSVKIKRNNKELKSFDLPERINMPYLNEAYRSDLNNDGISDYICVFGGTGCGLASEYCHAVFVLSYPGGYEVNILYTMGFGPEDVVEIGGNGKCIVIHTWFVYGEKGKDGETHNYWVYNFFQVGERDLFYGEKIPWKWVMYTHKPNHKDTDQLTDEQKIRCWLRRTVDLFVL